MSNIFTYLKESFKRKKARRVFSEYPAQKNVFDLKQDGAVEFYNWNNPLVDKKILDQTEVDFFRKFIPEGSLAIDIGTNIGDTTVPIGLAAGSKGLTVGFDPNPHVFKIAKLNAELNKDKTNIHVYPHAISDKDGTFYYTSSEASFGNGGISDTPSSKHGKFKLEEKILGVNLEGFLTKNYAEWLPKLSFIKIDTEGYDKEIIKSIKPLLDKYQPTIIAECFKFADRNERVELYDIMISIGYRIYYFADFTLDAEIREIISADEMVDIKGTYNFYGIKK